MKLARIALLVVLATESAAAQRLEPATDIELLSAYCTAAFAKSSNPTEIALRARFWAYLQSRAVYSGRISGEGANVAAQRGGVDAAACHRAGNACLDKCFAAGKRTIRDVATCGDTCTQTPECARIARCYTADRQIPF